MINTEELNKISNKIKDMIKSSPTGELEHNLNALLKGALTKMELVTREEFDIQTAVLQRTRQHLDELKQRVEQLESTQK